MMESWAASELRTAALGDPRRVKRLIQVVETLAAAPSASVPEACGGEWATIKGTYRFWDNDAVEPDAIRAAHRDATVARLAAYPLILAIQDTTEVNVTGHPAMQGVGHLAGQGQRGMLAHSVLALSPDGVPLGLLSQEIWARDPEQIGSRHSRRQRPTAEKESARWLRAQAATLAVVPAEIGVLTIADREADIYDLLAAPRREEAHLLIRATHQRRIADTEDGEAAYVWSTLATAPVAGTLTVQLQRTPTRPAREATLAIRWQQVEIQPPRHHRQRAQCRPILVTAILATEQSPPPGRTAVSWRLLTTWPVEELGDVLALVEAYTLRWLVERYHYILKSGCRIEELQVATTERLDRALATYGIVAWRVLWLTYLARAKPESSGQLVLSEAEYAVLVARSGATLGDDPTLATVVRAVAKLGGFIGRTGDGDPGPKVLWRGLRRLGEMAAGWELHQALTQLHDAPLDELHRLVGNG